jgi:hypothetical protein
MVNGRESNARELEVDELDPEIVSAKPEQEAAGARTPVSYTMPTASTQNGAESERHTSMSNTLALLNLTTRRTIAAAVLLAVSLTGCAGGGSQAASSDDPRNGSGSSAPAIDYHDFPYNLGAGAS